PFEDLERLRDRRPVLCAHSLLQAVRLIANNLFFFGVRNRPRRAPPALPFVGSDNLASSGEEHRQGNSGYYGSQKHTRLSSKKWCRHKEQVLGKTLISESRWQTDEFPIKLEFFPRWAARALTPKVSVA